MTRQFPIRTHRLLTFDRLTRFPMVLFLIILPLLITSTANAQPPDTLWTKTWDYGSDYEYMEAVRALPDGGYIATGYTDYYETNIQYWTARLDQDGNEIWLHIEGSASSDGAHYIEPTSDGGFIQCGEVWGNGFDPFIRKLDADGNEEWMTVIGGWVIGELFYCVHEVPAGGYIAVGYSANGTAFRFDEDGNFMWQWTDEDSLYKPQWIEPTADGGFVTCSDHWNEDLQTRVPIFYKLDADGDVVWSNDELLPGQPVPGKAYCVREDEDGSLYTSGAIRSDSTGLDFNVAKRTSEGNVIWSLAVSNPDGPSDGGSDRCYEHVILPDGSIIGGGYGQDVDNYSELWLMKVSSDGEMLWRYETSYGDVSSLDLGRDGSIIAAWYPRLGGGVNSPDLALIKWEPEVEVLLSPYVDIVPPQGRRMHYRAYVSNILLDPTPLDVWATVTTPAGNTYPLQQITVTLQPGGTFYRPYVPLDIPAAAPPGEYTFELHVGVAPPDDPPGRPNGSRTMGLGSFTFTKSGTR